MARFVIVPQWQGSPSARAMQLIDGAQAIAGDLPRSACTVIDVPLEAGEALETGVLRYSALSRTRDAIALQTAGDTEPAIVVGGDCGVSIGAIGIAADRAESLAVVWFDAHPDLHLPSTSLSGAFGGMALSAVLGDGTTGLALEPGAVTPDRVVLAGARDYETDEESRVAELGIRAIDVADLVDPAALAAAVAATGATEVYVHVDLDVLDPSVLASVTAPVPFGLTLAQLTAAIAAVRDVLPLAGATIAGFAPGSPDAAAGDLGTILRVVGALA
ncbi:arginase family protein [Microbacterium sp. SS28]|uniref:arginase family protein n=1 Tax=Microbacterium sp. SS28 TaxID=2919948 RepID=UPI001FAA1895|nr:arginase family protein [Microbacterium sp. SS28]